MVGLCDELLIISSMFCCRTMRPIAKMTYSPILIGGGNRVISTLGLGVKCSHTLSMLRFRTLRPIAKMTYSPILNGGFGTK